MKSINRSRSTHSHQIVKATRIEDGKVLWFWNVSRASQNLGFSHVLGVKVANGEFKQAKGWRLKFVEKEDVSKRLLEGLWEVEMARRKAKAKEKLSDSLKEKRKARREMVGAAKGSRIVVQSKDGKVLKEWENANKVCSTLGISYGELEKALYGFTDTVRGYVWRFKIV